MLNPDDMSPDSARPSEFAGERVQGGHRRVPAETATDQDRR